MTTSDRITTREAKVILGADLRGDALALLRGASVPHERIGSAYLWDRRAVESLGAALGRHAAVDARVETPR